MPHFTKPLNRIPLWFADELYQQYPNGFTTHQAVNLYIKGRSPRPRGTSNLYWPEMNARNALSCMAQVKILVRTRRGHYTWNTDSYTALVKEATR